MSLLYSHSLVLNRPLWVGLFSVNLAGRPYIYSHSLALVLGLCYNSKAFLQGRRRRRLLKSGPAM